MDNVVAQITQYGYAQFPQLLDAAVIAEFREVGGCGAADPSISGTGIVEHAPALVLPLIANAKVLDVIERVMGPFVQLDTFSVISIPPGSKLGINWHRDPYGSVPRGTEFQRPLGMNLLVYLQDLDSETGPLRVIPGSHRRALVLPPEARHRPHVDEALLNVRAGDAILLHNNLIHSRSQNKSDIPRMHVSIVHNLSCMRQRIDLSGPVAQSIIASLARRRESRLLRLLGRDLTARKRYNAGFVQDECSMWNRWIEEDAAGLTFCNE